MRTALTAAQKATLRARPHAVEYYAAIHQPRVIWSGNFLGIGGAGYPGSVVTASGTSQGHFQDIVAGMTLRAGTDRGGNDLGTIRVRGSDIGSAIRTAEYGSGFINWAASPWLTVVEEYRPWPIHHRYDSATSRWEVDWDIYTSQLGRYGPIAVLGPPTAVWLEGANGGRGPASYVGDRSYSMTVGASITSQSWSFPNGQTVTSVLGSSQNPIVITYTDASSGGRYHSLTVTDGNGNSHIGQRITFAFNTSSIQPYRVRFEQITGGLRRDGYETRLYVSGSNIATSSQFPEGAQVVVFEKASYAGAASSIGGNFFGRNHVVLVGWIQNESVRIEPFTGEVSFAVRTIDGELEQTNAYDLFLESGSAASAWDMASGLTLDRAAIALTKYRSTISNVTDFYYAESTASTNEIPYRSLPAGNLWEQLKYNYDAQFGLVAADMQSSIYAQHDAQVTGASLGTANVIDIAAVDRRGQTTIEKEHRDKNALHVTYAIQSGASNAPLGAYSPGLPGGYFGGRQELSRNKTAPSQDTLITWTGNLRARDNNPYKRVAVPLAGNYRIDSVPQCRITMSLSPLEVQNVRGINWNNKVFLPTETTINYDHQGGFVNTELIMESSVDGIGGSALTFPKITTITPPNDPPDPPPPPPGGGEGEGGTVYMVTTTRIGRTRNWNNSSPNWVNVTGAINVSVDIIRDFILDPYDPQNIAYCCTDTRVYKSTNLDATFPTWTQVAINTQFGTGYTLRRVKANITAQDNIALTMTRLNGSATELHISKTANGGTSWSAIVKILDYDSRYYLGTSAASFGAFEWAQHSTNYMYAPFNFDNANPTLLREGLMVSTDGGATWAELVTSAGPSAVAQFAPTDIIVPYEGNEADTTVWFLGGRDPTAPGLFRYDPVRGLVNTSVAGVADQDTAAGPYKIIPFVYSGGKRVYFFSRSNATASILYTEDEGATWITVNSGLTTDAGSPARSPSMIGLWPYDSNKIFAVFAEGPQFSTNGGYNFSSKLGDWNSIMGAWTNHTGIIAVPVWVL